MMSPPYPVKLVVLLLVLHAYSPLLLHSTHARLTASAGPSGLLQGYTYVDPPNYNAQVSRLVAQNLVIRETLYKYGVLLNFRGFL